MRVTGVLHSCPKDNALKFFNPNMFANCPTCGEDMTNKPMKMYDVGETKK